MLLDLQPFRPYEKSGYWRLFYYNLQAESLRAEEQKKKIKEASREAVKPKPLKKPKPIVPAIKRVVPTEASSEPFVLAPVKTLPTAYDELIKLPPIQFAQIYWRFTQLSVIISLDKERKRRRRKVAAFLLLAA